MFEPSMHQNKRHLSLVSWGKSVLPGILRIDLLPRFLQMDFQRTGTHHILARTRTTESRSLNYHGLEFIMACN